MSEQPRFRLRPLRSADFDRVLELERVLFGAGAWTYGMLADELAGLGRWYVVAELAGPEAMRYGAGRRPVIGYAGLWFDGDVAQVMTIGVDPEYQRLGVGRELLRALVDRSRQLGASAVLLEVRVDNEPALALYRAFGFEQIGLRRRYYQPEDKDAYTMRLDLSASGHGRPGPDAPQGDAA
ncbi:ribosomal protein S18-alanine N-acetyltransferase [Isoptericola variabilis]|uniref:Ribosomal-protein-alanine acetyltransferase n=1 Tax=Isoptericola variabilis (strain 225) TaxID=743718 RepID=F6FWS3_ISOV2|nr:ribosomal protein S18-alanine N-acetyltransferase [Isoptericola variabilis]AEG43495.1 ribosomal-protein-alanine acetyltransferase [Isoptericola variabilis 225]TWH32139.1 ribosomal-protein-alanine N-acetyltransferase [Isoptericola variabilis J7]